MSRKQLFWCLLSGFALIAALGSAASLLVWSFSGETASADVVFVTLSAVVGTSLLRRRSATGQHELFSTLGLLLFASAVWRLFRIVVVVGQTAAAEATSNVVLFEAVSWFGLALGAFVVFFVLARRSDRVRKSAA